MNCNINDGNMQRHLVGVRGYGMRYYNAILWVFVGTGTINRTLRLRSGRGDTWIIINKNNEIGNANIYQRTFRNIHLLRKCMATNTPQGVGADSSRPFYNPNQMVLMCRNDANCNANNANMQRHFVVVRGYGHDKSAPTAADGLPFCGCLRICKYQKIVHQRTLATCYNTTTYTECLLSQCKNHTFAM